MNKSLKWKQAFFSQLFHLIVPRHGNASVLSNFPLPPHLHSLQAPNCPPPCPTTGQQQWKRHKLPRRICIPGSGGKGHSSLLPSLLVRADCRAWHFLLLWGRSFPWPEGKMLIHPFGLITVLEKCVSLTERDADEGKLQWSGFYWTPEPARQWRLSGRSQSCCPLSGISSSQDKKNLSFAFKVFLLIGRGRLGWLKTISLTDCRC